MCVNVTDGDRPVVEGAPGPGGFPAAVLHGQRHLLQVPRVSVHKVPADAFIPTGAGLRLTGCMTPPSCWEARNYFRCLGTQKPDGWMNECLYRSQDETDGREPAAGGGPDPGQTKPSLQVLTCYICSVLYPWQRWTLVVLALRHVMDERHANHRPSLTFIQHPEPGGALNTARVETLKKGFKWPCRSSPSVPFLCCFNCAENKNLRCKINK